MGVNSCKAAVLSCLASVLLLGGCDAPGSEQADDDDLSSVPPAVVQTVELASAEAARSITGVAMILNPDPLLQLDADLRAATLAADFSRGQLARFKLSTSLSRQTIESAERQAGLEATQQKLLETRLRQTWGDEAPFLATSVRQKLVSELSEGTQALVRMDFPDYGGQRPQNVRVAPLTGGAEAPVHTLWVAPSGNLSMPGVSYYGLINAGPGLRPGDRARLLAENSASTAGVVIPDSAIIVYGGQSWCYVETEPGKYERKEISLDFPVDNGYLARSGYKAGQRVVVRGASVLLAREAEPGDYDDDDDDGGDAVARRRAPEHTAANTAQREHRPAQSSDPD
jgi:multidrug efflux system membrane fusion protein